MRFLNSSTHIRWRDRSKIKRGRDPFRHNSGDAGTRPASDLMMRRLASFSALWPAGSAGLHLPAAGPARRPRRMHGLPHGTPAPGTAATTPAPPPPGCAAPHLRRLADGPAKRGAGRGYPETVVRNLDGLQPLQRVIAADRSQAELNPGSTATCLAPDRLMVSRGQALARPTGPPSSRIEERFSVQREIVLAIWGMETRYGRVTGNTPVLRRWPRWRGSRAARRSFAASCSTR
jgi:membrane-bound lytic murein transglycosylase B